MSIYITNFMLLTFYSAIIAIFPTAQLLVLIVGCSIWSYYIYANKKIYNINEVLVSAFISSIPFSFLNIFGTDYSESIISWYNIFLLVIGISVIIKVIIEKKVFFNVFYLIIIVCLISVCIILFSKPLSLPAISQTINIFAVFALVILGINLKNTISLSGIKYLYDSYVVSCLVTSVFVVIQFFLYHLFNLRFGNIRALGKSREAFGFFFNDYSFISVFLALGAMILFNRLIKKWSMFTAVNLSVLLSASIATSARTGIFSFIIAVFFSYVLYNRKELLRDKMKFAKLVLLSVLVFTFVLGIMYVIRGKEVFSSSSRDVLIVRALKLFFENPVTGLGFGGSIYAKEHGVIPHNLVIQSLVQGGVVFTIPLLTFLAFLLHSTIKNYRDFSILILLYTSSLFIPDLFSSRFMGVFVLLISIQLDSTEKCFEDRL